LSQGVLVTEGAQDSGSLITANDAFVNSRIVFAVPGSITSSVSKRSISHIAKAAKMVTAAKDIIEELGITTYESPKGSKKKVHATNDDSVIIEILQDQSLHFDEIVKRTGFSHSQFGTLLSLMEMKGLIKSSEGGFFIIDVLFLR
jgi:DNA processing protein